MAMSNWWSQWTNTNQTAPQQQIQNNGLCTGTTTTSSSNIHSGLSTSTNIPQSWATTTTGGYTSTSTWNSSWNSNSPLIDAMRDLLVSLGFVENLIEHTYELDLKTKVRIPVSSIADLPQSQAQVVIGQYLDEMKSKIIEQVTDKILINRLIDTEKKDKNIKDC